MRTAVFKAASIVVTLAALAGVVHSAPAELGMDIMQTIEDTNKSLSSNISLKDAKATLTDAKELEQLFGQVEAHFTERGDAENAVDLSKKSRSLAQSIVESVGKKNFDAAGTAATDLSRTCRTCHTFYKKE
jgi:hypothetical protein